VVKLRYDALAVDQLHIYPDGEFGLWRRTEPGGCPMFGRPCVITGYAGWHNGYCDALVFTVGEFEVHRAEQGDWAWMGELRRVWIPVAAQEAFRAYATLPIIGLNAGLVVQYELE